MDSTAFSKKAPEPNVRLTRLAVKEAARIAGRIDKPIKRKRFTGNEISPTATNGSKDQMEDAENDEEERSPNKIRKISVDGMETSESEEDMEVKDDEEGEDGDQDQDMSEQEDEDEVEEDSGDVRHEQKKSDPVVAPRDDFMMASGSICLRSRRSIHSDNQRKEVLPQKSTESMSGMSLHNWEYRPEPFSAKPNSRHWQKETVFPKANLPTIHRHVPSQARLPNQGRLSATSKVYRNNLPPQKLPVKVGKADLGGQTIVKPKSYSGYDGWFWKLCLLLLSFGGVIVLYLLKEEQGPPHRSAVMVEDTFQAQFLKVRSSFPSQTPELWKRGKIHLERHLQTAQPTEPVSMILTSGSRAEKTLHCLASYVAAAFSTALNSSVLHIDGASKAGLESDQVKLDIDNQLRGAFEGDKKAAIIHRFEELPPGSTLIFYRYCDHENAAFKNVLLVFTVQLPFDELSSELSLNAVEEQVQAHVQRNSFPPHS
ncbi:hypothetical protein AGOR_G00144060 [Albula goreensis]|uniref:Torsin-1A-interacting protein 1/2 AAA+ activator domain-containing protein n=1 Tax=Albula goreensis TaxID=1534307 RepID=A0A8T3D628_9TELE|nr:hypothetical protein AGOR_G00144060 [Albula goreensis]